jgi:excinuclease ABC subunit C
MDKSTYNTIAPSIPQQPGVYKYFDEDGIILYVGKAKNLRKRVTSYFNKDLPNYKTRKLVEKIHKIEFTIVDSEQDAFLLESSLIKHYQPMYNIELKDDKSYPYIVIKKEEYPRIFLTRRIIKDGSTYLGPFTSVGKVRELLEVIRQSLPIRTCKLALTETAINKGAFKSCLEYQIGNCKAPCINKQTREDYNWYVAQIKDILKGKLGEIKKQYIAEIKAHAEVLEFEKANIVKQKLEFLQQYTSRSVIVNTTIDNIDICTIHSDEEVAMVNYMAVFNGTIVHSKTVEIYKKLNESDEEILEHAILELRQQFNSTATEVVCDLELDLGEFITVVNPKLGDKKKLIALSQQNAIYFYEEMRRQKTLMLKQSGAYSTTVLAEIKEYLHLKDLPTHIECFDNSNFQGSYPVAAMVCFKDGQPFKKQYRHFHIKTVEGINDFASMSEIVFRRYSRVLMEKQPLPNLIIIDGGKGQLGAALDSLRKLNLLGKVAIVGLAKNIEELFFPGDKESIKLPYNSEALKLITNIRDEVHRFGITFHRNVRSKGVIKNELEDIKGIGESTAMQLLQTFKSVKKIKALTQREIAGVVGTAKARIVFEGLHKSNQQESL